MPPYQPPLDLQSEIQAIRRWQPFWLALGIGWSALALGLMALGLHAHRHQSSKMSLGEWGEFLGGVATALSFGWLVIGYFLQSAELKINSLTLGHQAEQQESQAKQQGLMAAAGEEQVKAMRSLAEAFASQASTSRELLELSQVEAAAARTTRFNSIKPVFQKTGHGGGRGGCRVYFKNLGHLVHDVLLSIDTGGAQVGGHLIGTIAANQDFNLILNEARPDEVVYIITYKDVDGNTGRVLVN